MLFKLLKTSLASKGKSGLFSKKRNDITLTDIDFELETWLHDRDNRYTRPVNKPLNESVINNLTGRDGWDDWDENKVHTEGAI